MFFYSILEGLMLQARCGSARLPGPEGDPRPGEPGGKRFHTARPGFPRDYAGGSKGFFEIDQQETHWRKCCHSPRGGFNWPPPPAGCEIRGGPAPSGQDWKLHWHPPPEPEASLVARPPAPGSDALASVTDPLPPTSRTRVFGKCGSPRERTPLQVL